MKLNIYLTFLFAGTFVCASAQKNTILPQDRSIGAHNQKNYQLSEPVGAIKAQKTTLGDAKGGDEPEAFWGEDFSNGLDGQGENGAWTTEGAQGDLWFQTFLSSNENGYDPNGLVPEYGNVYPNYSGLIPDADVTFPTADNGFMMFDADRANSTQTDPDATEPSATFNTLDASMISPPIDLTGVQSAQVTFWERWRLCCGGDPNFAQVLSIDFSTDGGLIWNSFSVFELTGDLVQETSNPNSGPFTDYVRVSANISPFLQDAEDLSDCRIRVSWNPTTGASVTSHYFALFDDIQITTLPDFDINLRAAAYDKWLQVILEEPVSEFGVPEGDTPVQDYLDNLEYSEYQVGQVRPFTFVGDVFHQGAMEMTNVIFEATVETPSGSEVFTSDPITMAPGDEAVITIEDVELAAFAGGGELGDYTVSFRVFADQDEGDLTDNNTAPDRLFSVTEERTSNGSPTDAPGGTFADGTDNDFLNQFTVVTETQVNYIQFSLSDGTTLINNYGEEIFLNIGEGAYYSEDDLVDFFPEDELTYEIEESEVTQPGDAQVQWITMMLPEERTLMPGVTYYVNLTVPIPEIAGEDIALVTIMDGQENTAGVYLSYDEPEGPANFVLEDLVPALRAGFVDVTGTRNFGHLNFSMEQNYPNPIAGGSTRISWALTEAAENITFSITDNTGKTVYRKDLGDRPAGSQEDIVLDGLNFAAGVYQYGIKVDNQRIVRKMMIAE